MGNYAILPPTTPNMPIKADWGRGISSGISSLRPMRRDGQRISTGSYGTKLEFDPVTSRVTDVPSYLPFDVMWQPKNLENPDNGEWQIYLPYGCVSVGQQSNLQAAIPVNDDAKQQDGSQAWQWYAIPKPNDSDALVATWEGYVAKEWTVYLHVKPWPRFKVSTQSKDKEWGRDEKCVAVATVGIVTVGEDKWYYAKRLTDDSSVTVVRNTSGVFAVRYEITGHAKDAAVKVKIVNQTLPVGRADVTKDKETNATNWETAFVKIVHDDETAKIEVEETFEDGKSNDDQTVFQIYEFEDNVIVADLRDRMPTLDFYTNKPDSDNA